MLLGLLAVVAAAGVFGAAAIAQATAARAVPVSSALDPRLVAGLVRRRLERRVAAGTLRVTTFQSGPFPGGPFGAPPREEPFAGRPSQPRMERQPGDEVDAEFTEEDGPRRG